MDALPFAATKIQPPRGRRARLARPALEAALGEALQSMRVVLLQAPAGYGKTSLLAAVLASRPVGRAGGTALAWISLDEEDDEQRLFACLAAALEPFDLPWRTAPEALAAQLGSDGGAARTLVELINALAGADVAHGVIVLDDLHRVEAGRVHALVEGLIERLPAHWSVVLVSRTVPPLPLARWRAAGELAVFDQDRLAFSAEDTAAFAAAEGVPERAAELHARTQGWPAGMRLLLAAPAGGGGAALDRQVFEFLASEVIDEMPLGLHDFLLRTAVLPELTAARAAAVSGDARAAQHLDDIERRGLFVTALDADERTLVLHDLFRAALLDRLRRTWPGQEAVLLRRAADGEIDPVRRVGYLLRSRDWPAAEAALAETAAELLLAGGMHELQRLVDAFDAGWREQSPRLLRLAGLVSYLRWDWEPMAAQMRAAADAAARLGHADERDLAEAYLAAALYPLDRNAESEALLATLRARPLAAPARRVMLMAEGLQLLRSGRMVELPALYADVLALLDPAASLFAWWECVPPINWTTIPGMRPLIDRYVQGALVRIGGRPLPMRAEINLLRAFDPLWAGDLAAAEAQLQGVADDLRWLACSGELEIGLHLFRLLLGALRGRADAVRHELQAMRARDDRAGDERRRLWQHQVAVYGVRMHDVLGADAATLAHWAGLLKENPLASADAQNARAVAVRARHAAAEGRWAEAATGFARLLPKLHEIDVMGHAMELRLRAAHALAQAQRLDEAAEALRPALQRVVQEGVRGQALLAGPGRLLALVLVPWRQRLSADEQALLADLAAQAAALRGEALPAAPAAPEELLSQREREVLAQMAAGDSNKLIARALDISPHTVKRHVANILDKLQLASRGQAAAWWRDHGA